MELWAENKSYRKGKGKHEKEFTPLISMGILQKNPLESKPSMGRIGSVLVRCSTRYSRTLARHWARLLRKERVTSIIL